VGLPQHEVPSSKANVQVERTPCAHPTPKHGGTFGLATGEGAGTERGPNGRRSHLSVNEPAALPAWEVPVRVPFPDAAQVVERALCTGCSGFVMESRIAVDHQRSAFLHEARDLVCEGIGHRNHFRQHQHAALVPSQETALDLLLHGGMHLETVGLEQDGPLGEGLAGGHGGIAP